MRNLLAVHISAGVHDNKVSVRVSIVVSHTKLLCVSHVQVSMSDVYYLQTYFTTSFSLQDAGLYLKNLIPPVLACFYDQDSRVRYYACEALYNIAKVARGSVLPFFNDVFDGLSKVSNTIPCSQSLSQSMN